MNYHNITKDDMLNGDGLRVVLWVAGCTHHCKGCHNPFTHSPDGGLPFGRLEKEEIFEQLKKRYISGITFSGGDPLHDENLEDVGELIKEIRLKFPDKDIWLYTGYTYKELEQDEKRFQVISSIDVLVDGRYKEQLMNSGLHWRGSSNQRIIHMK